MKPQLGPGRADMQFDARGCERIRSLLSCTGVMKFRLRKRVSVLVFPRAAQGLTVASKQGDVVRSYAQGAIAQVY